MKPILALLSTALFVALAAATASAQLSPRDKCDSRWAANDWKAVVDECSAYAELSDASAQSTLTDIKTSQDSQQLKTELQSASPGLLIAGIAWTRTAFAAGKLLHAPQYDSAYSMAMADLKNVQFYGSSADAQRAGAILDLLKSATFLTDAPGSPLLMY